MNSNKKTIKKKKKWKNPKKKNEKQGFLFFIFLKKTNEKISENY
jgi:hypothetical protein